MPPCTIVFVPRADSVPSVLRSSAQCSAQPPSPRPKIACQIRLIARHSAFNAPPKCAPCHCRVCSRLSVSNTFSHFRQTSQRFVSKIKLRSQKGLISYMHMHMYMCKKRTLHTCVGDGVRVQFEFLALFRPAASSLSTDLSLVYHLFPVLQLRSRGPREGDNQPTKTRRNSCSDKQQHDT